jgi:hypothetical protein
VPTSLPISSGRSPEAPLGVASRSDSVGKLENKRFGFDKRVSGSHHIFRKEGVLEKINLQKEGNKAKPYQVRQVRNIILKYKLGVKSNG